MLSFDLAHESTALLKEISDTSVERSLFLESLPPPQQEYMKRCALVSTIGSSTRIENAVLTDTAVAWMDERLSADGRPTAFLKEKEYIEHKLSKERERSIEEVAGCRAMLSIIHAQAEELFPLSIATLIGLHRELLQYYPPAEPYLGKFKIVPNNVIETIVGTSVRRDVLRTADPGPITETAMRDLVDWYNATLREHPWALAVAAEFVFRFLAIHPFQDGNGRVGRALFTLAILQSGDQHLKAVIPYLAVDRHIEKTKEEYYLVLRRCSDGMFSPDPRVYKTQYFLGYMLKIFRNALANDIDYYARKYTSFVNLADAPRTILECFKSFPETKLSYKDVGALIDMPRRTALHALAALVRKGFLQKTGRGPSAKYQLTF